METHHGFSTIAGEKMTNHNVRLESEQGISMLCADFLLDTMRKIDFA